MIKTIKRVLVSLFSCLVFIIICSVSLTILINTTKHETNTKRTQTEETELNEIILMRTNTQKEEKEIEEETVYANDISTPIAGIEVSLDKVEDEKEIVEVVKSANEYDEDIIESLTTNEITMIERLVEAEATEGNVKEKSYVASVILNRLVSDEFPDTIEGVVFQKHQFSPISDGRYYEVTVTKSTKKAVKQVLDSGDKTEGALFFCNPSDVKSNSTKSWFNKLTFIFTDDIGHHFFK